jgi:hypothetical protein
MRYKNGFPPQRNRNAGFPLQIREGGVRGLTGGLFLILTIFLKGEPAKTEEAVWTEEKAWTEKSVLIGEQNSRR